jgi:hypothetical protein
MTILAENIKNLNRIEKHDMDHVSTWLFNAVKVSTKDNKNSIEHKIDLLKFLLDYLPHAINIESLASDEEQLSFIKLLSKLTDTKEELEILIGKKTTAELEEIGKNFSKKTQYPIGFTD